MTESFSHDGSNVIVQLETGGTMIVATAIDKYWADAIAFGLNIEWKG
jgi:hypothetical protein